MNYKRIVFLFAVFAILAFAAGQVQAQAADQQNQQTGTGKEMSVTGCLAQGSSPNTYQLTANGRTWDLVPEGNVNFADHVGHKVKVTGTRGMAQGQTSGEMGAPSGGTSGREELRVTNIQHISGKCTSR